MFDRYSLSRAEAAHAPRHEWLDALRGWAIAGVVLVHCTQLVSGLSFIPQSIGDAGQYGVQLFFIVSALTICLTYDQELARSDNPARAAVGWLARRVFRIVPLYYFGIVLYGLAAIAMRAGGSHSMPAPSAYDILANIGFAHSWISSAQSSVVPGGWSIGVEMTFYLCLPFLFTVFRRRPTLCIVGFLAALVGAEWLDRIIDDRLFEGAGIQNNSYLYFWFPTQFPVFVAGIALFECAGGRLWREARYSGPVAWLPIAAFVSAVAAGLYAGTVGDADHVLAPSLFGIAGCMLVLMCKGPLRAMIVTWPLVRLGRVSYGVYINHFVVLYGVRAVGKLSGIWSLLPPGLALIVIFAITLSASLAVSWATRRYIENPGMEFGRRLSARLRRAGSDFAVSNA